MTEEKEQRAERDDFSRKKGFGFKNYLNLLLEYQEISVFLLFVQNFVIPMKGVPG